MGFEQSPQPTFIADPKLKDKLTEKYGLSEQASVSTIRDGDGNIVKIAISERGVTTTADRTGDRLRFTAQSINYPETSHTVGEGTRLSPLETPIHDTHKKAITALFKTHTPPTAAKPQGTLNL